MTAAKLKATELPHWPRLLSPELAAAYLGVSPNVLAGLKLEPLKIGNRILYDIRALDRWVDETSGVPQAYDSRGAWLGKISKCGT